MFIKKKIAKKISNFAKKKPRSFNAFNPRTPQINHPIIENISIPIKPVLWDFDPLDLIGCITMSEHRRIEAEFREYYEKIEECKKILDEIEEENMKRMINKGSIIDQKNS